MNQRAQQQEVSIFDQQVTRLEARVNQLQASLSHWQQWYWDYSSLKEEVDTVVSQEDKDQNAQRQELLRIKDEFESDLLKDKELDELFGENDRLKPAATVSSLIGRRIDYVEKNVETLTKLVEAEEEKLARANIVAHPDAAVDEETGLPITDIVEQLDDDDNVMQYQLRSGTDAEPHVVEALRKLGIQDIPKTEADLDEDKDKIKVTLDDMKEMTKDESEVKKEEPARIEQGATPADDADSAAEKSPGRKKSVSFAEDTKPGHKVSVPTTSPAAQRKEEVLTAVKEREAKETKPAAPEDESPEDADLRRQMEEYTSSLPEGWSEVHNIVAELEIDSTNEDDDEDDLDWIEDDDEESWSDDEDELGRSKHSVITNDYIRRMQALEKKLGFRSHFGANKPGEEESETPEGEPARIVVKPEEAPAPAVEAAEPKTAPAAPKQKKSVKFASELDIADEKKPAPSKKKAKKVEPVNDIVEKIVPVSISDEEEEEDLDEPPKRVSRFKKERKAAAKTAKPSIPKGPHQLPASFLGAVKADAPPKQPEATLPDNKIVADTLIERVPVSEPREPVVDDELDDALLYKVASVEYHRLRNQMIQKQGGFVNQPEREIIPLEEEEGGPPRVSRFKAARLGK